MHRKSPKIGDLPEFDTKKPPLYSAVLMRLTVRQSSSKRTEAIPDTLDDRSLDPVRKH